MVDRFLSETVHILSFRYHFSEMLMILFTFAFLLTSSGIAIEDLCQCFAAVRVGFYAYRISVFLSSIGKDTTKGFFEQIGAQMFFDTVKDPDNFFCTDRRDLEIKLEIGLGEQEGKDGRAAFLPFDRIHLPDIDGRMFKEEGREILERPSFEIVIFYRRSFRFFRGSWSVTDLSLQIDIFDAEQVLIDIAIDGTWRNGKSVIMKDDRNGMTLIDAFRKDGVQFFQFHVIQFWPLFMERDIIFVFVMGNIGFIIELRKMTGSDGAASIAYEREAADGSAVRELAEIRTDGVTANIGAVFAQTGIAVIAKTFLFAFILNTTFVSLILTNEELTMGSDLISDAARIAMKLGSDDTELCSFIKQGFKNQTLFQG